MTGVQLLPSSTAQPPQLPLIFQTAMQLPNPFLSIHAFSLSSQLISIPPLCFPVRPFLGDCSPFLTSCPDRDLTLALQVPTDTEILLCNFAKFLKSGVLFWMEYVEEPTVY